MFTRLVSVAVSVILLCVCGAAQDIGQQIAVAEQKLNDPNLPPELKGLVQTRLERLRQVQTVDAQISTAMSLKTDLGPLTQQETDKIDEQIKLLQAKRASLLSAMQSNAGAATPTAQPSTAAGPVAPASRARTTPNTTAPARGADAADPPGPPAVPGAPAAQPAASANGAGTPMITGEMMSKATSNAAVMENARGIARTILNARSSDNALDDAPGSMGRQLKGLMIAAAIDPEGMARLQIVRVETSRVDKQVGASPGSSGTTSLIEKPGIPSLLGFAIENGAIDKDISGTAVTLRTTPYAFLTAFQGGDTQKNYQQFGAYSALGLAASFNVADQENVDPTKVTRQQLDQWSAKLRLTPDRSVRSPAFHKLWLTDPQLAKFAAEAISLNKLTIILAGKAKGPIQVELIGADDNWDFAKDVISQNSGLSQEEQQNKLAEAIVSHVAPRVEAAVNADAEIDTSQVKTIVSELVAAQQQSQAAINRFNELAKQFANKFTASLEYLNKRQVNLSDYSTIQLLANKHVSGELEFTINAAGSFYHSPNKALNQGTFREFSATFAFQQSFGKSPFMVGGDASKITATLSGRYQRIPEYAGVADKKADVGTANFKVEIPVASAVTLPFSVTYASAADQQELKAEKFVRGNFGLTFDLDKLYAILHQVGPQ
jgi:hypothetical protein